jgi:hypothetical protein
MASDARNLRLSQQATPPGCLPRGVTDGALRLPLLTWRPFPGSQLELQWSPAAEITARSAMGGALFSSQTPEARAEGLCICRKLEQALSQWPGVIRAKVRSSDGRISNSHGHADSWSFTHSKDLKLANRACNEFKLEILHSFPHRPLFGRE